MPVITCKVGSINGGGLKSANSSGTPSSDLSTGSSLHAADYLHSCNGTSEMVIEKYSDGTRVACCTIGTGWTLLSAVWSDAPA